MTCNTLYLNIMAILLLLMCMLLMVCVPPLLLSCLWLMSGGADSGGDGRSGGDTGSGGNGGEWNTGYATWYNSYPACCKDSPTYDKNADTKECTQYSGCKYMGRFAGYKGQMSHSDVKNTNIVAFYDDAHQGGSKKEASSWWNANAKNKEIEIRHPASGKIMKVKVMDTCGNHDCGGCCSRNAKKGGGYLLDLEGYTATRFWGSQKNGTLEWRWV